MPDSEPDEKQTERLREGLKKVLDRHGYGFQYSVIEHIGQLRRNNKSRWIFWAAEFPVQTRGKDHHIDLVLQHTESNIYLVGECKRVNPTRADWCFVKNPYVRRDYEEHQILLERLDISQVHPRSEGVKANIQNEIYGLGVEIKGTEKGDSNGDVEGVIEKSVTQVCKAMNGLAEFIAANPKVFGGQTIALILPVLFTTANIWTSDVNLHEAELSTGVFDLDKITLKKAPWVWYRYHQSPGLKHSLQTPSGQDIAEILDIKFARTIAVVGASGVEDFISREFSIRGFYAIYQPSAHS